MNQDEITQAMVRSRLLYVPAVSGLVWLARPTSDFSDLNKAMIWNARYAGQVAGSVGTKGYRMINIFGKMRKASRLTWVCHYGYWPECVDHIDGNQANDDVQNLRDVSHVENMHNRKLGARNTTGTSGVFRDGDRFRAQISVAGRHVHLGTFLDLDGAVAARKDAEKRFGFHPNHGRVAA